MKAHGTIGPRFSWWRYRHVYWPQHLWIPRVVRVAHNDSRGWMWVVSVRGADRGIVVHWHRRPKWYEPTLAENADHARSN